MLDRRHLLGAALALPAVARAQVPAWPDRPVRYIIGGSAGGVSDILLRILENRLRETLGQPIVLEPKPGAGGMVGAEFTARSAAPDGYTYYINHIASHGIGPTLYKKLAFDPMKDLPGVARIAFLPNVLIVKGDSPIRSVAELVAFIKANPAKATFASAGTGTSSHLSGVLLGLRTGVEVTHVPYRGTAPSMAAVLNGEVLFAIDNAPASRQQVLAGMLRALAVSSGQRASTMPELPTMQEAGVPDFDVTSWYGIATPAAVPRPIVEKLSSALVGALNDPAIAQRIRDYGAEPAPLGPADYDAFMRSEIAKWAPVVRASGASID